MDKKLYYILFTLFLSCILVVSCSNKDKTGSSDTMYVGNWYEADELVMIVGSNGDISFPTIEK
ncbi:hypothetical protein [Brachyspira hyodysenteriae]|uniref:hypothetical protein n=1 Tax=Brachyspira hyodysenteriae TaxID=159 RepID=UPI000A7CDD10|nr:hypothetical protein [Brachyspira hyodysenteriae]